MNERACHRDYISFHYVLSHSVSKGYYNFIPEFRFRRKFSPVHCPGLDGAEAMLTGTCILSRGMWSRPKKKRPKLFWRTETPTFCARQEEEDQRDLYPPKQTRSFPEEDRALVTLKRRGFHHYLGCLGGGPVSPVPDLSLS
ncbi:hypothetical protein AVEN_212693-1 [Araneus ventricosus]|uniref:Uncharacterized protein n=1 Tax=Araneus ventricosus TaxID=182803 RepID=A0A4Y2LHD9_ARAVE|nr:hypothetical protein AVEN_212693-1 [Araneus ventricosus]